MSSILHHFDALTGFGLQIIPLRENSKIPLCKGWTKSWDKRAMRSKLVHRPNSNIGLLLGDIIDVEGDSPEANDKINDIIGDYNHPSYTSKRSTHHLFINPWPTLRIFKHKDIEFRAWGHQSVLPPSSHEGVKYTWLDTDSFPIPQMPDSLKDFFTEHQKKYKYRKPLPEGCFKAICDTCKKRILIHKKRHSLEAETLTWYFGDEAWSCVNCRLIDPIVFRRLCRNVRGRKRRSKLRNT